MQRCGQCDYSIRNEDKMLKHLSEIHGIHIGIYSSKKKITKPKKIKMPKYWDKINDRLIEIIELMKKNKLSMIGGEFGVEPINHWKYKITLPAKYRHKKEFN